MTVRRARKPDAIRPPPAPALTRINHKLRSEPPRQQKSGSI